MDNKSQEEIIQQTAQYLNIDEVGAKEFLGSITSSDLASVVSSLDNLDIEEIQNIFNKYTANYDFDTEIAQKESIEEMDDLDHEYEIRKEYDDLKRKGVEHHAAFSDVAEKYNLTDQELLQVLKGPMTEYTNSFDSQINESLSKIETLKINSKPIGANIIKGLSASQIQQVISKSSPTISNIIDSTKKLSAEDTMESYAKLRGFETIGLIEHELDIETMQDSIIEHELCKVFEAMKNKWKKRSYWRKRPKNDGLGTVGHEDFDHDSKMDANEIVSADDYGTISVKELKDYIVSQGKK